MNQTWENGKKPNFGPHFDPNSVPKIYFCNFYNYYMLCIVSNHHCMQSQENVLNQTWKNGKKPSFWPDFGSVDPNLGPKNYFAGFYHY